MLDAAEGPDLLIVEPAQDAGPQALSGRLGGHVGHGDADVHGAVVIVLHLGAHGGRLHIGHLRHHQLDRRLGGEFVHAEARGQGRHLLGKFSLADGHMIGLTVAGRGGQPQSLQDRIQLLPLHLPVRVISPAGLAGIRDLQKIHKPISFRVFSP